ncbi:MAG: OmpA family protein [Gammaproteobacteria bacterium]
MAYSTRRTIRAWLGQLGGLAFAGCITGCASTAVPQRYPLGNDGKPLTTPGTVCVQIGLADAARQTKRACYQLQAPGTEHIEPLPLDEFGYLYPPLKPEASPSPATSPAAVITAPRAPIATSAPPTTGTRATAQASVFTIKTVEFRTALPFALNSAHLTRANRDALTNFVNALEQYRGVLEIRVTGHTDASGGPQFNLWLSRMRAESVRLHLLALGMDPRHIQIRGVGSREPRPHARSAAANRYVDVQVEVRVPQQ